MSRVEQGLADFEVGEDDGATLSFLQGAHKAFDSFEKIAIDPFKSICAVAKEILKLGMNASLNVKDCRHLAKRVAAIDAPLKKASETASSESGTSLNLLRESLQEVRDFLRTFTIDKRPGRSSLSAVFEKIKNAAQRCRDHSQAFHDLHEKLNQALIKASFALQVEAVPRRYAYEIAESQAKNWEDVLRDMAGVFAANQLEELRNMISALRTTPNDNDAALAKVRGLLLDIRRAVHNVERNDPATRDLASQLQEILCNLEEEIHKTVKPANGLATFVAACSHSEAAK